MAKTRRAMQEADIEKIVGMIKSFRKKPTWNAIVKKAQGEGLPFQQRAIQGQPLIKSAYDAKVAEVRKRRESGSARRVEAGLPRSKTDIRNLLEDYKTRIEDLTSQNLQLAEQIKFLLQRCGRENIELEDINRPLAFPRKN